MDRISQYALCCCSALGYLMAASTALADPAVYLFTDLGTLGGNVTYAMAINNRGEFVGHGTVNPSDPNEHVFWGTRETGLVDLGTFGSPRAQAYGISDDGTIAGFAYTDSEHPLAFRRAPGGSITWLPGIESGYAYTLDLSSSGTVVGSSLAPGVTHAVLWNADGSATDLGTLPGFPHSDARGINRGEEVVGSSSRSGSTRAIVWRASSGMQAIIPDDVQTSCAEDINDGGTVVGFAYYDTVRAFIWDDANGLRFVPAGVSQNAQASAINNLGEVVGVYNGTPDRGFVWSDARGLIMLDSVWGTATSPTAVNDHGWIVGRATDSNGRDHAVLWIPGILGDMNCDLALNNFDIDSFILALTLPSRYVQQYPGCDLRLADMNADGFVDNFDIDRFVECVVAGGCP